MVNGNVVSCLVAGLAIGVSGGALEGAEWRSIDGTGNNAASPGAGAAGGAVPRHAGTDYADGVGAVGGARPNAREVSNAVFDQRSSRPSARGLSEMVWVWGQFLDHDLSHTLVDAGNGTLSVTIPEGDPFFDNGDVNLGGQTIDLTRSDFAAGTGVGSPRVQVNNISAWLDASNVYGGRAEDAGAVRHTWLRTFEGGRLKTSSSAYGEMMPLWSEGAPEMDNVERPTMGTSAYVAGDVRANEQPALAGMHTLFVREHNRLAGLIGAADPSLSDEAIYQRARKIVGAQMQRITYGEYLPALGIELSGYGGYDAGVDPAIASEFSTAAFRFGHTQVTGSFELLDAGGRPMAGGALSLADAFFNPAVLETIGIEPFFRGLAATRQETIDAQVIGELRNQLFQSFVPGIGLVENGTDLVSLNIMRGRDHGLEDYNTVRESYGLAAKATFAEVTGDPELAAALASVYDSPDEMDVFVGLLSEDLLPGVSVGELTAAIIAEQFERLRDGDRFWYERGAEGVNSDLHDLALDWDGSGEARSAAAWLGSLRLSDVLELNLDASFQDDVFFAAAIPTPGTSALLAAACAAILHRHGRSRKR